MAHCLRDILRRFNISILDCEWFCVELLSQLVKLGCWSQSWLEKNGFMRKKELEKILKEEVYKVTFQECAFRESRVRWWDDVKTGTVSWTRSRWYKIHCFQYLHFEEIRQPSESLQVNIHSVQRLIEREIPKICWVPINCVHSWCKIIHLSRQTHSPSLKDQQDKILKRVARGYELRHDLVKILSSWKLESFVRCVKASALRIRSRHDNVEKVEIRRFVFIV